MNQNNCEYFVIQLIPFLPISVNVESRYKNVELPTSTCTSDSLLVGGIQLNGEDIDNTV